MYTKEEEGLYMIKRVERLPNKGNANWLYTIRSEVFKRLYRWRVDKTWEVIDLQASIGGIDETAYLESGSNISISGTGSFEDPYIISSPLQNATSTSINAISGISSTNVQGALQEIKTSITTIENTYSIPDGSETIVTDGTNVLVTGTGTSGNPYIVSSPFQNALNTPINAISGLSATEVQGALEELSSSTGNTDLSITNRNANTLNVNSSTGTDITLPSATISLSGS